jgi:hypothetical protein
MYYPARQPDSDTFRLWEVAGGSHAGGSGMGMPASLARDLGMPDLPIDLGQMDPPSAVSIEPVRSAAFHHLHRWLTDGTPAPSFPRLEMGGDPPVVYRDERGNGLGGIRLPDMVVPTATNKGDAIDGTRSLTGSHQPFSPETLRAVPRPRDLRRAGGAGHEGGTRGWVPVASPRRGVRARRSGRPDLLIVGDGAQDPSHGSMTPSAIS